MATGRAFKDFEWLVPGLMSIDFNYANFWGELSILGQYTYGQFPYNIMANIDFDLYDAFIKPFIDQFNKDNKEIKNAS